MLTLAVETSCDETAVAVLRGEREVLANHISSQVEIHKRWGGVVPEVASRSHLEQVFPLLDIALATANIQLAQVDAYAVTNGPGLQGALLVGVMLAKTLALLTGKPVVGVNHLEGHMLAVRLEEGAPQPPFLTLVVSGGHTSCYVVRDYGRYELLGATRDDAAGEAYDKVARLLGLGYPGGPVIDRLAAAGRRDAIEFPRALLHSGDGAVSFSGLKTAALRHVQANGIPSGSGLADFCASFQEAVCEVLVNKLVFLARQSRVDELVVCGGVAANSRLRSLGHEMASGAGMRLTFPSPRWCTDNAAMIAVAGYHRLRRAGPSSADFDAVPGARLA